MTLYPPKDLVVSGGTPGLPSPTRALPASLTEPLLQRTQGKKRARSPTFRGDDRTKRTRVEGGRRDRKACAVRALAEIEWLRDRKQDVLAATTEVKQGYERMKAAIISLGKERACRKETATNKLLSSEEARLFANARPEQREAFFRMKFGAKKPYREHTAEELEALYDARARLPKRPEDYTPRELADLYRSKIDATPVNCTCRRTTLQQNRANNSSFTHPRPRMGVDAQGVAFEDWSACPPQIGTEYASLPTKELLLRYEISGGDGDARIFPIPLGPRRPRAFSTQFTLQFRHIPSRVHDTLEAWHAENGRCLPCIAKAMRTLPPWIIGWYPADYIMENGNPVFVNLRQDELVEWDESRKGWRHLILDHHRWVPVEELEERPSDSTADPKIVPLRLELVRRGGRVERLCLDTRQTSCTSAYISALPRLSYSSPAMARILGLNARYRLFALRLRRARYPPDESHAVGPFNTSVTHPIAAI
ncbi:hypothetical protein PUNSTDRAFT_138574 [Punctularia strigosozonata HHB-11173 SS5]|uniref:Uncharacterized protein n=1 Tax=Punctularia strigosozonata (strain HHB-11173) TaxID=741275 RepID=R7S407_PUNST|nr:uncharacterized protein PUNSTDRAFT_138574 [Punctularia strigosozonata HHB-11173 SS5]EIN04532.1 hypothetical protein PUNSTDRAFT_138574 [Punctularia strigosozonata HHB-11173 SS5]